MTSYLVTHHPCTIHKTSYLVTHPCTVEDDLGPINLQVGHELTVSGHCAQIEPFIKMGWLVPAQTFSFKALKMCTVESSQHTTCGTLSNTVEQVARKRSSVNSQN